MEIAYDTASIGNQQAGKSEEFSHDPANALFLGVRWDGDKIRGIRVELDDGTGGQVGGYDDTGYVLTTFSFIPGETFKTAYLRNSGYGYGSVRQIEFTTSKGRHFFAGPQGFDSEVSLAVDGTRLAGYHAWVNPDNFINALAFKIHKLGEQPIPWIETHAIGNESAAGSQVELQPMFATARYFGVRWDGDKIRGLRVELEDGTFAQAGGYDDVQYTLTGYTFTEGETLETMTLKDSGYGYGSLRRIQFTTSTGGTFSAGPDGFNIEVDPEVRGTRLCGFHAWVNSDNFINAFAARITVFTQPSGTAAKTASTSNKQ